MIRSLGTCLYYHIDDRTQVDILYVRPRIPSQILDHTNYSNLTIPTLHTYPTLSPPVPYPSPPLPTPQFPQNMEFTISPPAVAPAPKIAAFPNFAPSLLAHCPC